MSDIACASTHARGWNYPTHTHGRARECGNMTALKGSQPGPRIMAEVKVRSRVDELRRLGAGGLSLVGETISPARKSSAPGVFGRLYTRDHLAHEGGIRMIGSKLSRPATAVSRRKIALADLVAQFCATKLEGRI
jgi:hypothetical protein